MMLALLACGMLPGEAIAHGSAHLSEQVRAEADARSSCASDVAGEDGTTLAAPAPDRHQDIRLDVSSARSNAPALIAIVVHAILVVPVPSERNVPPTDRDDAGGGNASRGPPPRLRAPPSLV